MKVTILLFTLVTVISCAIPYNTAHIFNQDVTISGILFFLNKNTFGKDELWRPITEATSVVNVMQALLDESTRQGFSIDKLLDLRNLFAVGKLVHMLAQKVHHEDPTNLVGRNLLKKCNELLVKMESRLKRNVKMELDPISLFVDNAVILNSDEFIQKMYTFGDKFSSIIMMKKVLEGPFMDAQRSFLNGLVGRLGKKLMTVSVDIAQSIYHGINRIDASMGIEHQRYLMSIYWAMVSELHNSRGNKRSILGADLENDVDTILPLLKRSVIEEY